MRKNKLVAIILLAVVITVLSVYLFSTKKIRIDYSGEKMIASDGKGPYEGGVDGVQTYSTKFLDRDVFVIQTGSRRSVSITFANAPIIFTCF